MSGTRFSENLVVPERYTIYTNAINLIDVRENGLPARIVIVGGISGSLLLTRLDGTVVTVPESVLLSASGILECQFTAMQSAACTDLWVGC